MLGFNATTTSKSNGNGGADNRMEMCTGGNNAIAMRKKNDKQQHKPTLMLINNDDEKQQIQQQLPCAPPPLMAHQRHHYCLFGTLHLLNGMKVLVAIGLFAIATLCVLAALYFRRSLFVMGIPGAVLALTIVALGKRDGRFCWPIIGISFFHLFLDAYATLIFLFFFFFKPLYIIMVLNWAFDTMYTTKTTSYYVQCGVIFMFLVVFFLFNLWQLCVSYRCLAFLKELHSSSDSSISSSSSDSGSASDNSAAMVLLHAGKKSKGILGSGGGEQQQQQQNGGFGTQRLGLNTVPNNRQHVDQHQFQCKMLNQPPMMLSNIGDNADAAAPAAGIFSNNNGSGNRAMAPPPAWYAPLTAPLTQQIRHAQPLTDARTRRPSSSEQENFGLPK